MSAASFHFGNWLRREIEGTGMSRRAFADTHQLALDTLNKWVAQRCPRIRGYQVVRIGNALGLQRDHIEQKLAEAWSADSLATAAA